MSCAPSSTRGWRGPTRSTPASTRPPSRGRPRSCRCSASSGAARGSTRPGAQAALGAREEAARALEVELDAAGLEPVRVDDRGLAIFLEREGRLIRLGDGFAIGAPAYERARDAVVAEIGRPARSRSPARETSSASAAARPSSCSSAWTPTASRGGWATGASCGAAETSLYAVTSAAPALAGSTIFGASLPAWMSSAQWQATWWPGSPSGRSGGSSSRQRVGWT